MDFPYFQVPYLGNGMTIGLNAVIHVLISHGISIGLFLLIVLGEYIGYKNDSKDWTNFSKNLIKPVAVIITTAGAITGVGIWFTTSALAPAGIGSMIRIFFWPWFTEWIVFSLEVILILIYFFSWHYAKDYNPRKHIRTGVIYVVMAFISAYLITGILSFMLTTDGWPWEQDFLLAFFNPSFISQLATRIGIALSVGSFIALGYTAFKKFTPQFKKEAMKLFGKFAFFSLILFFGGAVFYSFTIPKTFLNFTIFSVLTSHLTPETWLFWTVNISAAIILFITAILSLAGKIRISKVMIIPAIILICGFVTEFERVREFIRGPYLIPGYMYANQVLVKENVYFDQSSSLGNEFWIKKTQRYNENTSKGLFLFGKHCSVCHTIGGINDIRARLEGRTYPGIKAIVERTHQMIPFMVPFAGSDEEKIILSDFLFRLSRDEININTPSRFLLTEGEGKNE